MFANPFTDDELAGRLQRVRAEMAARKLDLLLLSTPENVFYLTGLDHWGYFAPHLLIVPAVGDPVLITRAMEKVAVANQVRNARFAGHPDNETAADMAVRVLEEEKPAGAARIGVEAASSGHSYAFGSRLRDGLATMEWVDATGLVELQRLVKSPAEQDLMRDAARVSDAGAAAGIAALHDGADEREVAAECTAAMIRAGGAPPGFGPFIRPGPRLGEEHTTWGGGIHRGGDRAVFEISGCVGRYHSPLGRVVHVGDVPDGDARTAEVTQAAFEAVLGALKPGVRARDVYGAWQAVVDDAGLSHYRRHHCGYCVGIGFPPSWMGGNTVTGLRHDSALEIRDGMSFHILSWLMGSGIGDFFLSNTVLLGPDGPEVLTRTPNGPTAV